MLPATIVLLVTSMKLRSKPLCMTAADIYMPLMNMQNLQTETKNDVFK